MSVKSYAELPNSNYVHSKKKDVKDAAGSLQVCTGLEAELEAAIHTIYDVTNKMKPKPSF